MSIYLYNTVDINKIGFDDKPYKKIKSMNVINDSGDNVNITKSIYYVDMNYLNKPLYIQIPCFRLRCVHDDTVELIINKEFYDNFIKGLQSYIVDTVYNKSERWFLGKTFTRNKIIKCLVMAVNQDDNEYVLTLGLSNTVVFYDKYKNEIDKSKLTSYDTDNNIDIVCIIKVEGLQFIDNMFICNLVIEQAKITSQVRLIEYSIIDSDSDSEVSCTSRVIVSDRSSETILEDEYYKEFKS